MNRWSDWLEQLSPWAWSSGNQAVALFDCRLWLCRNLHNQPFAVAANFSPDLARRQASLLDRVVSASTAVPMTFWPLVGLSDRQKTVLANHDWFDQANATWAPFAGLYCHNDQVIRTNLAYHLACVQRLGTVYNQVDVWQSGLSRLFQLEKQLETNLLAEGSGFAWSLEFGYLAADIYKAGSLLMADYLVWLNNDRDWSRLWRQVGQDLGLTVVARPWTTWPSGLYRVAVSPHWSQPPGSFSQRFAEFAQFCVDYLERQAKAEIFDPLRIDAVYRSLGIMRYATTIEPQEYKDLVFRLLQAWSCGILKELVHNIPLAMAAPGILETISSPTELAAYGRKRLALYLRD